MNFLQVLQDSGVIAGGHFVLSSGKHSNRYIDKDGIYTKVSGLVVPTTLLMSELVAGPEGLGEDFLNEVVAVVGPQLGGIPLSQWLPFHLNNMADGERESEILSVFATKTDDGGFDFSRSDHAERIRGQKILIAEDIVTSAGSVVKVAAAARKLDAEILGVVAIANRGGKTAEDIGVPWFGALLNPKDLEPLNPEVYDPDDCPLCAEGVPINTNLGHAKKS